MNILPLTLIRSGGLPLQAWSPMSCGIPDWGELQQAEQQAATQLLQAFDQALSNLPESTLRTAIYNARKAFFQRQNMPAASFLENIQSDHSLTQLAEALLRWQEIQRKKQAAEILFEQNISANYKALQAIAQDETLRRGLLFASHDLLAGLRTFAQKPLDQLDKKDRRTAFSLLQYLSRAVFKTSPFGRFTTVQAVPFSAFDHPPDRVGDWLDSKPLVTPNVALLPAIYSVLLRDPAFYQSLHVLLNPSVAASNGGTLTWLYFDGEREAFQQMDPDPVADFVVTRLLANQHKMSYKDLIQELKHEVEATETQLNELVVRLIDLGLLEWQLPEKGLSSGWCGALYNYLGYLPSSDTLTRAAYLLQWMRTAARIMPFQTIEEGQKLQCDTLGEIRSFLEKEGSEMPPLTPEQVFFEDVAETHPVHLPAGTIKKLSGQLAECWQQKDAYSVPPFRKRLFEFAAERMAAGERTGFLEFAKQFMEHQPANSGSLTQNLNAPRHRGKIGALLQIFQENGKFKAVVNAMYPGGGKLFARWLPLFSLEVSEQIKNWHKDTLAPELNFPWQGWSNANFQPTFSSVSLAVPDGRVSHLPGGKTICLADLEVVKDEFGNLQLVERQTDTPIVFTDLGLEAPETRPPVMQVLWHLGVPFVSVSSLIPEGFDWEQRDKIRFRRRLEFQSLTLLRAAWELPEAIWATLFTNGTSQAERIGQAVARLKTWSIPRRFFGQFTTRREKPQFYDQGSPIAMLLLEKNLRKGSGVFLVTEMLPEPELWLGDRVGEFVVEFTVY